MFICRRDYRKIITEAQKLIEQIESKVPSKIKIKISIIICNSKRRIELEYLQIKLSDRQRILKEGINREFKRGKRCLSNYFKIRGDHKRDHVAKKEKRVAYNQIEIKLPNQQPKSKKPRRILQVIKVGVLKNVSQFKITQN